MSFWSKASFRPHEKVVFDPNPKRLVEKVLELVKKDKIEDRETFSYRPLGE